MCAGYPEGGRDSCQVSHVTLFLEFVNNRSGKLRVILEDRFRYRVMMVNGFWRESYHGVSDARNPICQE